MKLLQWLFGRPEERVSRAWLAEYWRGGER